MISLLRLPEVFGGTVVSTFKDGTYIIEFRWAGTITAAYIMLDVISTTRRAWADVVEEELSSMLHALENEGCTIDWELFKYISGQERRREIG